MSEDKFLHDLSSPLTTAILLLETIVEAVEEQRPLDAGDLSSLKIIEGALTKITKHLEDRREVLRTAAK